MHNLSKQLLFAPDLSSSTATSSDDARCLWALFCVEVFYLVFISFIIISRDDCVSREPSLRVQNSKKHAMFYLKTLLLYFLARAIHLVFSWHLKLISLSSNKFLALFRFQIHIYKGIRDWKISRNVRASTLFLHSLCIYSDLPGPFPRMSNLERVLQILPPIIGSHI